MDKVSLVITSFTDIIKSILKPWTLLILFLAGFMIMGIVNWNQIADLAKNIKL